MSEEPKSKDPVNRLKWFGDVVENLPRGKGDSFVDNVVNIESAKVVRAAGELAISEVSSRGGDGGVERGVSKGLENAGRQIIERKLTGEDPISSKVMDALGDFVKDAVKERLGGSRGVQSDAEKELAEIHRKDELNGIVNQIHEELIKPLTEQIQGLAAKVEENTKNTGGPLTTEDAVELVMNAEQKAKQLLKDRGFSVESVNVTKEEVTAMLTKEEQKYTERLTKEKEDWEKDRGVQVEVETQRIDATEKILTNVVDRVFDVFLEPLKGKIQEAIDRGAFRNQPPSTSG